ncbi:hypothetical protein AB0M54_22045 [Actinoplanes sp. NPDC051470]|uniref:hypothetical protein n=1 Tax=unclassified Actinoplanes TaxID=2626549 RepID=UPI00341A2720
MADEPPQEFVEFVADRLPWMTAEANRLTDGADQAAGIAALVLSDLALHWRRLGLRARLSHADEARAFTVRRLQLRSKQWRDDQIYQVEVRVLRPVYQVAYYPASYAARKAEVLASTVRSSTAPMAEAAIAWTYARRRAQIHKIVRTVIVIVVTIGVFLSLIPSNPDYY